MIDIIYNSQVLEEKSYKDWASNIKYNNFCLFFAIVFCFSTNVLTEINCYYFLPLFVIV